MKISLLGPEYASEMARLHGLGFARSWPETDFASHVQNTIDLVVGAFDEEKLMGFAVVRRQERQAEMLTIVVSPDSRGKGMGSKILKEAENRASSAGADIMFLDVAADNQAAIALYKRAGYFKYGERPGYYRRPEGRFSAYLYQKNLDSLSCES